MNNIIEVRGLCKKYNTFSLNNVGFSLPGGYIMGFIGPNGAGKTTTIKLILNIINSDSGCVFLLGSENTLAQNEQIGVVMDMPLYVDEWTAVDVESALSRFHRQWDRNAFAHYLMQFGIDKKNKIKELSRGRKIKLQIAAALSHNAKLLILDEPTSGLDPSARDEICDLLRMFVTNEEKGVLFSTHVTSDLEKTADYITFIMNGNIVFTGPTNNLLRKYVRVSGGLHDLTTGQRPLIIGYRDYGIGFEGMAEAASIDKLPKGILIESISMDEIIIYMNRGHGNDYISYQ